MSDAPEYVQREAAEIGRDRYRLQQADTDIPVMEQQLRDIQTAMADINERLGKARETRARLIESGPLRVEALRLLCEAHGWDVPQPPADPLNGQAPPPPPIPPQANPPMTTQADDPAGNTRALQIPLRGHRV
jgi:hypothetical protein